MLGSYFDNESSPGAESDGIFGGQVAGTGAYFDDESSPGAVRDGVFGGRASVGQMPPQAAAGMPPQAAAGMGEYFPTEPAAPLAGTGAYFTGPMPPAVHAHGVFGGRGPAVRGLGIVANPIGSLGRLGQDQATATAVGTGAGVGVGLGLFLVAVGIGIRLGAGYAAGAAMAPSGKKKSWGWGTGVATVFFGALAPGVAGIIRLRK